MTPESEVLSVVVRVTRALDQAGVDYLLGGSVAASLYGEPRATRDIDIAVRLSRAQVQPLIAALGPDFAVDEDMLLEAIRTQRSANIFFLPLVMKVDLFARGAGEYDQLEFSRKARLQLPNGPSLNASSPEDNLLWKLRWFKLGGEVSDQQWRDVLGLLRVSGRGMDLSYLRDWSRKHEVAELLERALAQVPP